MTDTSSETVRLGVVGTGSIAGAMVPHIKAAKGIELAAVASRQFESAKSFALQHEVNTVYPHWQAMIQEDDIDAVYIATPTAFREEVAIAAAKQGKHVLAEKPFASEASIRRIEQCCYEQDVRFMDATHFVHHPRLAQINRNMYQDIGVPQAMRSSFYAPLAEKDNIRFDLRKEPMGALGDLGWYCMRAAVEYLHPSAPVQVVSGHLQADPYSGAAVRGAGVIVFGDQKTLTFDFGFNAATLLMDLDIIGDRGVYQMNDFLQDWKNGVTPNCPGHITGYHLRQGVQSPNDVTYIAADSEQPHAQLMFEHFAEQIREPDLSLQQHMINCSAHTQYLLDCFWQKVTQGNS